jgi:diadenylate cyclase
MATKKEIQEVLLKNSSVENLASEEEFISALKLVAPGTSFRAALDGALLAGKGALIVVENDSLLPIMDGGFRISCKFTPQKLIELSKMDGAIVLSKDMKKINYANVLLTPESRISTAETGTRHRAAERTAKQIKTLVIAISERKGTITLYYKNIHYQIKDASEVLRKASEHVQLLEKQRELFDNQTTRLNKAELQNFGSAALAASAIQKGMLIQKIINDLKRYTVELGKEGTLVKVRLKEIKGGVERETDLAIKDYTQLDVKRSKALLDELSYDEILDEENILSALGYEDSLPSILVNGWRLLSKTSLFEQDIALLSTRIGKLDKILESDEQILCSLFGDEKGRKISTEFENLKISGGI